MHGREIPGIAGIAGKAISGVAPTFEGVVKRWVTAGGAVTRAPNAVLVTGLRRDRTQRDHLGQSSAGHEGFLFTGHALLENRAEVGALLSIPRARLADTDDDSLLRQLYERLGASGIAHALGAFVFASWNEAAQRLTLGRDCLGRRALFFHRGDGFVAFASDLRVLLSLPFVPRAVNEDVAANYLALNRWYRDQTIYRGIERVPSRTLVTIDPGGVHRSHYWSPNLSGPPPFKKEVDYIERARELFDQAVARATEDTPQVAILTSGGLDSSAIAATAARLGRARSITCFCIVPPSDFKLGLTPGRYLSERDKIDALSRMYPALNVELCEEAGLHPVEHDPVGFFVKAAMPIVEPSSLGAFMSVTDRIVRARFPAMLVGSWGNYGLTWNGSFSLLALLREGKFYKFISELVALSRQSQIGIAKTFDNWVLRLAIPSKIRRMLYRRHGRALADISEYSSLSPTYLRQLDLAPDWRYNAFDPLRGFSGWEPERIRTYLMFDHNQMGRDNGALISETRGFETRDPHADRQLLEFLLRVPEWLYRRNGISRSFARKVLADRLPPDILDETRRGAQGVTWFRRMDLRRPELAKEVERLAASPLTSRLIDVPRLKRILDDWPKDDQTAQMRQYEIRYVLGRGVHVGQFIRWVEGGNA